MPSKTERTVCKAEEAYLRQYQGKSVCRTGCNRFIEQEVIMVISNMWVAPHEVDDQTTIWLILTEVDGALNFIGAAESEEVARGVMQSMSDSAWAAKLKMSN